MILPAIFTPLFGFILKIEVMPIFTVTIKHCQGQSKEDCGNDQHKSKIPLLNPPRGCHVSETIKLYKGNIIELEKVKNITLWH